MAINYKTLGDRIKTKRISQGITQEKFAEKLGVDSHYISDIECGTRNITFKTLYKLMSTLDVPPYKLFTFD